MSNVQALASGKNLTVLQIIALTYPLGYLMCQNNKHL